MNSNILNTIMSALHDYKKSWNDRRHIAGCGPAPQSVQESIDEIIEKTDETIQYLKETSFDEKEKTVNPLCDFIKFFDNELNIFDLDGNRIFLYDVQIRELHKIHNNDKVKVNWTRQSGKDVIILSYLVYLAKEKRKRILIDAPNIKQKEDMMKRLYCISNCVYDGNVCLKFQGGGYITTDPRGHCCDVLFANEYDYTSREKPIFLPDFKKVIIVSKKLKNTNFVESVINWDELPGRDECFKQEMIKSIGLDAWYKEFEVTGMCEEFTASKMRKIADEQNCEADKRMIEKIEKAIKERAYKGAAYYYIDKPLREYVKRHFSLRGFDVEGNAGLKQNGTKISW